MGETMSDKTNNETFKDIKKVCHDNFRIRIRITECDQQRHELFNEAESLRKQIMNNLDRLDSLVDNIKDEEKPK